MARDRRNRRRPLAVTLSLLTVIGALALPAIAAPPDDGPKTYTAGIVPDADVCVETTETFTLTLVNTSSQQQLGSADVTPEFVIDVGGAITVTVDGAPVGTAERVAGTIELRDLAAAPGAAVELVFDGSSDTAGTYEVGVVAKQANDFKGNPGNDLTLSGAAASVTFSDTGACTPPYVFDVPCPENELCQTEPEYADGLSAVAYGTGGPGGGGLIVNADSRSADSYVCGTYVGDEFARIPATVEAIGVNLLDKVVAFQVDKAVDQAQVNNGASFYQVCATPQEPFSEFSSFVDIFGNVVANPDDPNAPGGATQTSGFLPDCGTTGDVPPCVISRTKTKAGDVLIRVRWGSGFRFG